MGVRCLHAHLRSILNLAAVKSLGFLQPIQLAGVVCRRLWVQQAPPRVNNVFGRDGLAGGPGSVGPQVKGVVAAILGFFPSLRDRGHRLTGAGGKSGQAFEERQNYSHLGLAGHQGRIERFGLRAIKNYEVRAWFLAGAAGENSATQKERQESSAKSGMFIESTRQQGSRGAAWNLTHAASRGAHTSAKHGARITWDFQLAVWLFPLWEVSWWPWQVGS